MYKSLKILPSESVFCLMKGALGGGFGSSSACAASATPSVLRERIMGAGPGGAPALPTDPAAAPKGPARRGGGSGAPRREARNVGWEDECIARVNSGSPVQLVLKIKLWLWTIYDTSENEANCLMPTKCQELMTTEHDVINLIIKVFILTYRLPEWTGLAP